MQFLHWDLQPSGMLYSVLLVSYRHFLTTNRSHLQGSSRTITITILRYIKSQKISYLTSQLIAHFQQSQFFSWWNTYTVVNNTLSGYNAARGSLWLSDMHTMCRSFVFCVLWMYYHSHYQEGSLSFQCAASFVFCVLWMYHHTTKMGSLSFWDINK